ncbi:MAG: enoyl-CoA hydratase/isomerase family protein [Candidatus Eremiobacteraeota bacterium]|nr:enoyl-CoA hydratase/isomerase family protein [Candidatus Eremiobacteraeota bacterium]MBC5827351.1 enoyl-CoA hydratase/isomerase family protein [Candidatus Eremiobacteraeota bacterium]
MSETIVVGSVDGIANVRLNRPSLRNALDAKAIAEVTHAFRSLSADSALRAVVLEGEGKMFCGGADINYMRAGLDLDEEANFEDALRLADMFAAVDECPVPVIVKVRRTALGGGAGLVAAADIAVAGDDAIFGFTEAKLGIIPAVISPFVLRKIGQSHARALFMTAERFDAARALRIGLVHEIAGDDRLDAAVAMKLSELKSSGPQAARAAKQLAKLSGTLPAGQARLWTARQTAERRAAAEGQEGLRAFLEKRKPAWA